MARRTVRRDRRNQEWVFLPAAEFEELCRFYEAALETDDAPPLEVYLGRPGAKYAVPIE